MSLIDSLLAAPNVLRLGINGYIQSALARKGEVVSASIGPLPAVFVSHPELIQLQCKLTHERRKVTLSKVRHRRHPHAAGCLLDSPRQAFCRIKQPWSFLTALEQGAPSVSHRELTARNVLAVCNSGYPTRAGGVAANRETQTMPSE